jgi:hypothetical protein
MTTSAALRSELRLANFLAISNIPFLPVEAFETSEIYERVQAKSI